MPDNEQQHPHVQARILVLDEGQQAPGVNLPTVEQHMVPLNDDDTGACTNVSAVGLSPWYPPYVANYVDNVDSFSFQPSDPWGFGGIESDPLTVRLASGAQWTVPLSWIAYEPGQAATQYRKNGGIIYPNDDGGGMLLNQTNTPNLVWINNYILALARQAAEDRYEMASLVAPFAAAIAAMGTDADFSGRAEGLRRVLEEIGRRRDEN